jgi:cytochrome c
MSAPVIVTRIKNSTWPLLAVMLGVGLLSARAQDKPRPSGPQSDGPFRKVILDAGSGITVEGKLMDSLKDPMEMAIAADGRVFYAERGGRVKMWTPKNRVTAIIGQIAVEDYQQTKTEDGLLGITLDPHFTKNGWLYLYYSPPESTIGTNGQRAGENVLSRFTLKGDRLDLSSEKIMLRVPTQRQFCCHSGGSLVFDKKGNLFLATGDNTAPLASEGYSPLDERPGHEAFDAQRSAANANDLRGKILRVTPQPDGTITIPTNNLFKPGTPGTRPEIYAMGCRNPFRFSVDSKTGFLYWGDVGPDAQSFQEGRGPVGLDEINQARAPGNFGWPYFAGDNKPYWHYDFATKTSGEKFDPDHPVNHSPNNTGIQDLPPAQPALIYYPYSLSVKFPAVNGGGGRTAMAGPVYYFDEKVGFKRKLPREFDHTLFIYEWSRNWIVAVHLNAEEKIASMERFCPNMTFTRPIDMKLGPDGCLYLIEWGTAWAENLDSQIVRIEYAGREK